jgi:hypothetical protein
MVKQHANGHNGPTGPCLHKKPKHPKGHKGPNVPCNHYLKVKSQDNRLGLVFYTSDRAFVDNVKRAVSRLRTLGVDVGRPRKLHVFHRKPYNGKVSSDDPMWSHYNPAFHSIQVMQGIPSYQETTRHELGHAILGHQCIQILSLGGSHQLTKPSKPGVAMAEGWANFVGLVLTHPRNEAKPIFKGYDWEKGTTKDGNSAGKKSPNIEFRVGCTLWDLYDKPRKDDEEIAVPFSTLFRVYSPTLKTLRNGPVIANLKAWIDRFKNNNPKIRVKVAKIVSENTR